MSNCAGFHSQLTSIMEVLTKAAVSEVCKLVDDGYAVLRLEISRSQKENEELKRKLSLQMLQMGDVRECEKKITVRESALNGCVDGAQSCDKRKETDVLKGPLTIRRRCKSTAANKEDIRLQTSFGRSKFQCADMEDAGAESLIIKVEGIDEDLEHYDPQGGLETSSESEGRFPTAGKSLGSKLDISLWGEEEAIIVDEEATPMQRPRDGRVEMEERLSEGRFIKREGSDWISGSIGERIGEKGLGTNYPAVKSAEGEEQLFEHCRAECRAGEDRRLDPALKEEPKEEARKTETANRRLQHIGPANSAGKLSNVNYEYVMCERPVQVHTYCAEEGTSAGTVSANIPVHSEQQLIPSAAEVDSNSLRHLEFLSAEPGFLMMDSVPLEAEIGSSMTKETMSESMYTQPRHSGEPGERERAQLGNVTGIAPPYVPVMQRKATMESRCSASDVAGHHSCNGSFPASHSLKKTLQRLRVREKRFICTYCGKSFISPKYLETHQRIHTGEKPFSCTHCGKQFADSSNCKRHQTIHTGERPFSCALCGKRFTQSSCLVTHQRVHTGEKPFSCTQCGKRFADSSNLKRHQIVHIGRKSLDCTQWKGFNFS